MVRARPLVSHGLVGLALLSLAAVATADDAQGVAPPASATAKPEPEPAAAPAATLAELPLERRPYRIRAWVDVDRQSRLDARGREGLFHEWLTLVRRFVGAPWELSIADESGPLLGRTPDQLQAEDFAPLADESDKLWAIQIGSNGRGGYVLSGRSFDVRTGLVGAVQQLEAPHPRDSARSLLRLSLALFTPSAEVGSESDGDVRLTVQGSALAPHSPVGAVARPGTLFVPVRIFYKPDGNVRQTAPIGWSYLRVEELEGDRARCSVVSSLRNPLSRRIVGRHDLVAVGIKPAPVPTLFRFETSAPESRPAAGYTLTWRTDADTPPRTVGITDRDGRIALPAGLAGDLVMVRLLAGGVEPLAEFPVVPGESAEERVIRVNPLPEAVTVEAKLDALRDVVVDQVALRARLESLLASRVDGAAWDDVNILLDEYRQLPPAQTFLDQLEAIQADARQVQQEQKVPVLTRTAQARIAETESLILRYLGNEALAGFEDAYLAAVGSSEAEPKAKVGWVPFSPPGGNFRVSMPGPPTQRDAPVTTLGGDLVDQTMYMARDSAGRSYLVAFDDLEAPPGFDLASPQLAEQFFESQVENMSGGDRESISGLRRVTLGDLRGIELYSQTQWEDEPEDTPVRTRIYLDTRGRAYFLMVHGPLEQLRSREVESFLNSLELIEAAPAPEVTPTPAQEPGPTPAAPPAGAVTF